MLGRGNEQREHAQGRGGPQAGVTLRGAREDVRGAEPRMKLEG